MRLVASVHYQSKVFVCVSVISGHMWIIAQMRSIAFKFKMHLPIPLENANKIFHFAFQNLILKDTAQSCVEV